MNLPNAITLFRLLLVPFFFTELVSIKPGADEHRCYALILFAVASFSDALDGFFARLTKKKTDLGTLLDPVADKLLLASAYLGLLFTTSLPYTPPLWITVAIIFRDIFIIIGLFVIYLMTGGVQIKPNLLGKWTTAAQMVTLIAVLLMWPFSWILWNVTAVLTILSFVVYARRELEQLKIK